MPTAPTISAVQQKGVYLRVDFTDSGTGDHNEVWRMCPQEYSGLFIKIAAPVPWSTSSAQFRDYAVASNRTYTYYLVAVAADGSKAAGNSMSNAQAMPSAVMTAYRKNYQFSPTLAANADGLTHADLIDFAPYQQSRRLNTVTRITANSTRPSIGVGSVRHLQVNPSVLIPYDQDNRAALRTIFKSPFYACLRTALGDKYFGRLVAPTEQYGATFTTPGLVFEQLSFNESV